MMLSKLKLLKHLDIWTTFLNIDNPYFEGMVNRIYQPELQLNKANTSNTEAPFFGFAFIYFKRICFILNLW